MSQQVTTVFRGKDKISSVFGKMGRNSDRFTRGVEQGFKRASKSVLSFKNLTGSILKANLIQRGMGLAAEGVRQVTGEFVAFDDSILSAAAKFKGLNLATQEGQKQLKELKKVARETGAATQFNAVQASEGLDFLALAGFNASQAMATMPSLVDLATTAGMEDLGQAVDIASDSLGAFGLMTNNTAQLQKNMNRVADVFAKTQATSNTNLVDLFETVKKGAPAFTAAGQDLETFAALTGVMASNSLKASESGTQLRNIMIQLSKPSKAAEKELKKLKIGVKDSNGNFRDALDIIEDVQKATAKLGTVEKSRALATIFGNRSTTALNILLNQGVKQVRAYREELKKSNGEAARMAEIMRTSLGNQLKSLQSALTEAGFKFFEAFQAQGAGGIQILTKAVREFDPQPIINGIIITAQVTKDLFQIIKSGLVLFSPLIAAFTAYKTILIGTTVATKAWGIVATIAGTATNALGLATWALNAAFAANPIGLIVIGVTALGAALFLLVKKWDVVKRAFINGATAIKNLFSNIWLIVKNIIGGLGRIGFGAISSLFRSNEGPAAAEGSGVFDAPNRGEFAGAQGFEGIFKFENKPDNVDFVTKRNSGNIKIEELGI